MEFDDVKPKKMKREPYNFHYDHQEDFHYDHQTRDLNNFQYDNQTRESYNFHYYNEKVGPYNFHNVHQKRQSNNFHYDNQKSQPTRAFHNQPAIKKELKKQFKIKRRNTSLGQDFETLINKFNLNQDVKTLSDLSNYLDNRHISFPERMSQFNDMEKLTRKILDKMIQMSEIMCIKLTTGLTSNTALVNAVQKRFWGLMSHSHVSCAHGAGL